MYERKKKGHYVKQEKETERKHRSTKKGDGKDDGEGTVE